MDSSHVWIFVAISVILVGQFLFVRVVINYVWVQAKNSVSATLRSEEGESAPTLQAKINRRSMAWDMIPLCGVTICEVSDGAVYRERVNDNLIEDWNGQVVIARRPRWRHWRYDFPSGEPSMTRTGAGNRGPRIFESGDWREALSSDAGEAGGSITCGRFQFEYDRMTKEVTFQLVDPAWRLRQIAIGYDILNRYSPDPNG
jgi:hypothetical protein